MNNENVDRVCELIHNILTDQLPELAQQAGFIKRNRKLTPTAFVRGLVLAWLANPDATLKELAASVAVAGSNIAPQSLDERFSESAALFFRYVLESIAAHKFRSVPSDIPFLRRFSNIYLFDSSTISLPIELEDVWKGCGGSNGTNAALKIHVGLEYRHGQLLGPVLSDAKEHDRSDSQHRGPFPQGSIVINDLGYFSLQTFQQYEENGVNWLSRLMLNVHTYSEEGQKLNLVDFLCEQAGGAVDRFVLLGKEKKHRARLLALRVPPQVAAERKRKLRYKAGRKGQAVSQKRLRLCEWTIFVTNIEGSFLTAKRALQIYGIRWQVELLFRLWKKDLKVNSSKSRNIWRILCEVYAKLIGAVLQHWLIQVSSWKYVNKSSEKASSVVRKYVAGIELALASGNMELMKTTVKSIRVAVERTCRINKSIKTPRTWQILLELEADDSAQIAKENKLLAA